MSSQDSKPPEGCQAASPAPAPAWPQPLTGLDLAILVGALVAAAVLAISRPGDAGKPDRVVVSVSGERVHALPLDAPLQLQVRGPLGVSAIEVQPGRARIVSSPCREQVCVRRGWLRRGGDLAVCVPNHLVVRLAGAASAFDGVSR